jgi:homopolymeric O-antigen transport system permease protein
MPSSPVSDNSLREVVYAPKPLLREPLVLLQNMTRDLVESRHLAYRLLIRSLRSQYRQSLLGYFWLLVAPIAATGGLLFLSKQNIFRTVETRIPYGLYLFVGILLWQIFTDSYQRPIQWLSTYRLVMGRVNFPREALILGALWEVLIQAGIRVGVLLFVLLWFGREIGVTFLFVPLAISVLIGLGLVVGLILAPMSLLYGDVERGVNLVMVFWFMMTPVVYPPPSDWPASLLNQINPVTPLVVTARELVFGAGLTQLDSFLAVSTLVIVTLLIGLLLLRLALPHLVERVNG